MILNPPDAVVVDGSYLLHRTYHALPPAYSKSNVLINAAKGIVKVVLSMYNYFRPKTLAVVFDSKEPSFRHLLSKDYKAHRPEYPEELSLQIPIAAELLEAFGITVVIRPGYEGDDIIGTLAVMCSQEHERVYIATADKDMLQLVTDKISVFDPFKKYRYNSAGVFEKLKVHPEQVADYLAMVGDVADGIKGVPGCGPVLASTLLMEYESLPNILASMESLSPNAKKIMTRALDTIELDRKLTGIVTDLDLGLTTEDLLVTDVDMPLVDKLCIELNVSTL